MTQAILLGAGRSSRMDTVRGAGPKWMLEVRGLSLVQHLVNVLHQCDVTDITVVRGSLGGAVDTPSVKYRDVLASRNMLETLYSVRDAVQGDVIVMYCDLLVEPRLVSKLLASSSNASVVVDRQWRRLFGLRANDPVSIAESCTIREGLICDIGQPLRPSEVPKAQYIGMMRFSSDVFREMMCLYEHLLIQHSCRPWRNADSFETAFMTDFLQESLTQGIPLTAVEIEGGWLEFDTPRDLSVARGLVLKPRPEIFSFDELWSYPSVISSGGLAIYRNGPEVSVLLVGTGELGEWRIPKGMIEPGETLRAAACREVREETGIKVKIEEHVGTEEWTYSFGGKQWHERCYFHQLTPQHFEAPRPDTENAVAAWVSADVALAGMKYGQERKIVCAIIEKEKSDRLSG